MNKNSFHLIENYMLACMCDGANDKDHIYRVLYTAMNIATTEKNVVPSPKKQTKNVREKPNEKNDKYNIKLLYPTAFIPRFA